MKIFVHAGTFKTGSSAFQNSLYHQRENLLKQGILYPISGLSEDGDVIGYRHSRFVYEYGKESYSQLIEDLRGEINKHKPTTLIISSEAWSRPGAAKSLFRLIDNLQTNPNEKATLYFVVRNVFDYTVSHYREFVRRWGWSYEFGDYILQRIGFFDYNKLFKPFVGKNINVKFLKYSQSVNETIIRDLGIEHLISADKQLRRNLSLTAPDAEIYRRFNIMNGDAEQEKVPSFEQVVSELGLDCKGSKFIEDIPPPEFLSKFDENYVSQFENITGLDKSLLDINQSRFKNTETTSLSNVKPLIDLYFSMKLKRSLLNNIENKGTSELQEHIELIQKFNWVVDVKPNKAQKLASLTLRQRLTARVAKFLPTGIKSFLKTIWSR